MPDAERSAADVKDYFASERTLLAWVRTGLAMMGFGFVVARFGLFLREMAVLRGDDAQHTVVHSLWFGVALILLGVVVTLAAAVVHWRTIKRLDRGEPLEFRPLSLAVVTAVVLSLLGLAMTVYFAFGLHGSSTVLSSPASAKSAPSSNAASTPVAPAGDTDKTPATPGR